MNIDLKEENAQLTEAYLKRRLEIKADLSSISVNNGIFPSIKFGFG